MKIDVMASPKASALPAHARNVAPISAEEWALRVDLAAAYRLAALYGWDDAISTHISVRVPGEEAFLLNPRGLFFEEITASRLVKVDLNGNILSKTDSVINPAGFVVHSAVHEARPDVGCVMHLHTDAGMALSCLSEGLLPLTQTAMLIRARIGYHDYEGVAVDVDERQRLGRDLGALDMMVLRNHGTLTVGRDVAEAFQWMYLLERAARVQMQVLATGRPLNEVTAEARQRSETIGADLGGAFATMAWKGHARRLDRLTTDYKD